MRRLGRFDDEPIWKKMNRAVNEMKRKKNCGEGRKKSYSKVGRHTLQGSRDIKGCRKKFSRVFRDSEQDKTIAAFQFCLIYITTTS